MENKKSLIDKVESFYVDIIEEFKEIELQIIADSKFRSIFKKKDYDGNIKNLRLCKKQVLNVEVDEKPFKGDEESMDVIKKFEKCLRLFNGVCDAYIQLQLALKKKSQKQAISYAEYREIFQKVQDSRDRLNGGLHELDIAYTNYTYDDEEFDF